MSKSSKLSAYVYIHGKPPALAEKLTEIYSFKYKKLLK